VGFELCYLRLRKQALTKSRHLLDIKNLTQLILVYLNPCCKFRPSFCDVMLEHLGKNNMKSFNKWNVGNIHLITTSIYKLYQMHHENIIAIYLKGSKFKRKNIFFFQDHWFDLNSQDWIDQERMAHHQIYQEHSPRNQKQDLIQNNHFKSVFYIF